MAGRETSIPRLNEFSTTTEKYIREPSWHLSRVHRYNISSLSTSFGKNSDHTDSHDIPLQVLQILLILVVVLCTVASIDSAERSRTTRLSRSFTTTCSVQIRMTYHR